MTDDLHNIDRLFKTAIDEYEEAPGSKVWSNIDNALDKNKVLDINHRYASLKQIAIALMVIVFGFSVYEIKSWKNNREVTTVQEIKPPHGNEQAIIPGSNKERAASDRKTNSENVLPGDSKSLSTDSNAAPLRLNQLNLHPQHSGKLITNSEAGVGIIAIEKSAGIKKTQQPAIVQVSKDRTLNRTGDKETMLLTSEPTQTANEITTENLSWNKLPSAAFIKDEMVQVKAPVLVSPALLYELPAFMDQTLQADKVKLNAFRKPLVSATIFISPDFASNHLRSDDPRHRDEEKDQIKQSEQQVSSLSYGVLLNYRIGKSLDLVSGVSFSRSVIAIQPKVIYARSDNRGDVRFRYNCSSGYSYLPAKNGATPAVGDSMKVEGSESKLNYVSIPLQLKYNYSWGKFAFSPQVGLSLNILSSQKIETAVTSGISREHTTLNEINGLKPSYFSGLIGIGAEYRLTPSIALQFSPTARLAMTSINEGAGVKSYPRSIGLIAGLQIGF